MSHSREQLRQMGHDELVDLVLALQATPVRVPLGARRPGPAGKEKPPTEVSEGQPGTVAALQRLFPPRQVASGVRHGQPTVFQGVSASLDVEPDGQAIMLGGVMVNPARFAGMLDALHIPVDPQHADFIDLKSAVVIHCGGRMTRDAGVRSSRTRLTDERDGRISLGVPKTWE